MRAEDRFEVARWTRAMVDLVERFLEGRASRHDLRAWARACDNEYWARPAFCGNGAADALYACVWNAESTTGDGQPLVRVVDLVEHVRVVREGRDSVERTAFATLWRPAAQIALQVRARGQPTRGALEGIGWYEAVQFASQATGRVFVATTPIEPIRDERSARTAFVWTAAWPTTPEARGGVVADLFDTLGVDLDEVLVHREVGLVRLPTCWDLKTSDDARGVCLVASFSGYAKARKRKTAYEALSSRQRYWIDPRHVVTEVGSAVVAPGQYQPL